MTEKNDMALPLKNSFDEMYVVMTTFSKMSWMMWKGKMTKFTYMYVSKEKYVSSYKNMSYIKNQ